MSDSPAPWDAAAFRDQVQSTLDTFVDAQAQRLAPLGADVARLVDAARTAVTGGKRLRAAFCHWGYRAAGGDAHPGSLDPGSLDPVVRAGAALELLHASALVHDDLMDASDVRRGRPTTHRAFESVHREAGWPGGAEQYGEAAAILLGDLLLSWADELLRRCGLGTDRVLAALEVLDHTRTEVVAGQFLDMTVQARGRSDVDDAMKVLRYKSAKYSVERPLHVGAALAGAGPDTLAALSAFGVPVGEAFQLRDDLLGVFGDPDLTGKPAGDDLVEGKRTVLVALALDLAPTAQADELESALGTPLDPADVRRLRAVIEDCGAHARVERMIDDLTASALQALGSPALDDRARTGLADLAAAATQRVV